MGTTVIAIPEGGGEAVAPVPKEKNKFQDSLQLVTFFLGEKKNKHDIDKLTHSFKVGIALVLVSILYLLDPLYKQVGENAMWAIMTVVVVFELFAGATLSKGLNRGLGTILGGGLGYFAAVFAREVGGVGNAVCVGTSVFIFGAAATYCRLVPRIKERYDYGAMILILTFNLVVVSGIRAEDVQQLACERLKTIVIGFFVCILASLLVFPIWASDELHDSMASKFENLASSFEVCFEEYFRLVYEKENESHYSFNHCKSVLHSKSKDESLANFARWEPWHGKFGFSYPWAKYLKIGENLRDVAATILSFKGCLQSCRQTSQSLRELIREPCEEVGSSVAWSLRELGDSIKKMRRCQTVDLIMPKLKSMRQELSLVMSSSILEQLGNGDGLEVASFLFTLMMMVDKVEELTKEVVELGELARFHV
ncbi:aluminum-activated malate transporter 14-like [Mangifera indica]|uniref:aluminum-activated malate transporter 14-like n=1 Tax=Mangifera indica TaxID=29780 RepID=UPI001CF94755|nr:aluminum-activated malate transporter 14-like [Mangifera indica]